MTTDYSAKIRDHLIKQRAQASTSGGTCRYRAERNGRTLMCAVGCLIPDERYSGDIEGMALACIEVYKNSTDPLSIRRSTALTTALPVDLNIEEASHWQLYHDGSCSLPVPGTDYDVQRFDYAKWCDSDMPAQSPAAFYNALKIHMANKAGVNHGDA